MTTTDKDLGRERILKEIAKMNNHRVVVGYWSGANKQPSGYAAIALYNERGTQNKDGSERIPPRPFMATAFDKNKDFYLKIIERGTLDIYDGKDTVKGVLTALGIEAMNQTKITITDDKWTPNAPSTVKRKLGKNKKAKARAEKRAAKQREAVEEVDAAMGTKPLIDDGALRDFILWEVRTF